MNYMFLGWILKIRVRVHKMRERRREEEKKEKNTTKMKGNGYEALYIHVWVGLTQTRPTLFSLSAVWSDPDGSGSIQRSWSVSLIRIHQVPGSGPLTVGLGLVFLFSWVSCYLYLFSCWLNPYACQNSCKKIPKKLPCVSWYIFIVWWCFHTLKWIKSMCANFYRIHMFWYFLWIFLCYFGSNFCSMELTLDVWFLWCVHLWIHAISTFLHA